MLDWSAAICWPMAEASVPLNPEREVRPVAIVWIEPDCSVAMLSSCSETAWLTAASCSAVNGVPLWAIASMMAAELLTGSVAAVMVLSSVWKDASVVDKPSSWARAVAKSDDRLDCCS
ncbi:hypothetical protein SDC9_139792 [bioreactor metagenome]|uniref:Uncharacterized protein n=1 Tax=bioreactor metagenome TaxID=1076179 RepID=A0A645DTH2_9ZZZZ